MKYTELRKSLESSVFSIYLLEGEDAFFRKKALEQIENKFVQEKSLNFIAFNGEDFIEEDFFSSIEMLPFMSEKRVTVINEFYPDKKNFERLKGFLKNPPKEDILVISNGKPFDAFRKYESVCLVDCSKADLSLIEKWIVATCKGRGVEIIDKASQMICEFCLFDMTRIESEVNKLCDFVGFDGVIDEDIVNQMVTKDTEYKIYEMTEAIGKRKIEDALEIINELLSKGETLQRLTVSIYSYYRRLLHVSISTESNEELSKKLGIKEFAVKKAKEQAKAFRVTLLKKAVDLLADADYKFKSGILDIDNAFYLSLFKIMLGG
ncbi:MAG: DNA polymerase III subunit delta [Firmicutes bacterium]|nr:DNA polymerase III subunit delta [Candidatus Caballimonas caccae]